MEPVTNVSKAGLPIYAETEGDRVRVHAKRIIKLVTITI